MTDRCNLVLIKRTQRIVAIRAIRGYRTIAHGAACALAGSLPWELMARAYVTAYKWRTELHARGVTPTPAMKLRRKLHDRRLVFHR